MPVHNLQRLAEALQMKRRPQDWMAVHSFLYRLREQIKIQRTPYLIEKNLVI